VDFFGCTCSRRLFGILKIAAAQRTKPSAAGPNFVF